ncbi:class I SAM-dependent methyltransferase [Sphaerisporangium corydalis]|uniref:Class I SAM-dependent methyltransferase n=1 Tax=Sphaerisporangium corydalis TaxID=1441875 RepID=A0ABV9EU19_9ACTN|nr:class I SAM-dependent methyltransferase [Sphaerisporangium corydalis]
MSGVAVGRRPSYGVDAPLALLGLVAGAVIALAATIAALAARWPFAWLPALSAAYCAASASAYAHTTLRGKFKVWEEELGALRLGGAERVLDLGCGRGAVLNQVAALVPRGRATGIDLWRSVDQSGNAEEVTRRNAEAEGVSGQVELVTGDMRSLPFEDGSFDLVVSSLAVHNIPDAGGRERAITGAYRVLAPGGRLRIADFRHGEDYAIVLRALGAEEVTVRDLGWRFWYGAPWFGTRMVSARRPA